MESDVLSLSLAGHIKSTMSGADDEAFLRTFEQSPKWLRMRA